MVEDYHSLDCDPRLNTASYVNVTFEPEEEKIALMGLRVNIADQTVYPESFKMHNDVLNILAKLWNCPKPASFDQYGCYPGAGTVGSTEACLLAGLALKFRWRNWYAARQGIHPDQVRGVYPNLVISTCYQACWEKLFKYMDIQPKFVTPSYKTFTMDPATLADVIDEKTIGVVCILGNHYGGQYDPVWDVDKEIERINQEKGFQVGIHVDAASGGFTAPFHDDMPPWDFRLKNVLSISASGHKFGNSCCGTGWIIWRERKGLSDTVAINVTYLGGDAESFTLNFSRPAQGIYVQFYKLLRMGRAGYKQQVENQMNTCEYIRKCLKQMTRNGKPRFIIIDAVEQSEQKLCLPVVTAMFNPELELLYDSIDFQDVMQMSRWYIGGYCMSFNHPVTHKKMPLFHDQPADRTMFRIVVKANVTMGMAQRMMVEIKNAVDYLDDHELGYKAPELPAQAVSETAAAGPVKPNTLLTPSQQRHEAQRISMAC